MYFPTLEGWDFSAPKQRQVAMRSVARTTTEAARFRWPIDATDEQRGSRRPRCSTSNPGLSIWRAAAARTLIFTWSVPWRYEPGWNLARMRMLNDSPAALYYQTCTGRKWVYYGQVAGPKFVERVSTDGGANEPVPGADVPDMYGIGAGQAISPDGKLLVMNTEISPHNAPQTVVGMLALVNIEPGVQPSSRLLKPDPRIAGGGGSGNFTNAISFTPDGKSVAYIVRDKGVDNIFAQPLDGSPGHQITNFTAERIAEFEWSPDGRALAVVRTHNTSDVVLLREK